MDIHKPHAPHSWGEFAREIATIVTGILIALGLEQGVTWLHERSTAGQARTAIRQELTMDMSVLRYRALQDHCVAARLSAIEVLVAGSADGHLQPAPLWIGRPPTAPMLTQRWQAALSSGRASLLTREEQESFGFLYALIERFREEDLREQTLWADLRTLEGWRGWFGETARFNMLRTIREARFLAWDSNYTADVAAAKTSEAGLKPVSAKSPASVCLPLDTPRATAVRLIGDPHGQP